MQRTTNPQGIQTPTAKTTAGGEDRQDAQKRHRIELPLWIIGMIVFIASCVIIHFHPKPYSFDLAVTEGAQSIHYWPGMVAILDFPSTLNNPIPSAVILALWFVVLIVIGLVRGLRKRPALTWFQAALFLIITVMSSAGLNVVVDEIVGRPRPNPHIYPIHLYTALVPFPTYPSGHTEHDIAYYGFLLYLSLSRSVREWKYRWILLPLQLYAVFDILAIGYSRVLEGDHWLTDVLGGYLEGALYLFFFIFLYRFTTDWLAKRNAKKHAIADVR